MNLPRRFIIIIVLILALGLSAILMPGAVATVKAGGSWSAWVYNQDTGKMVHVFPDGAPSTEMFFPLPPGTSTYPSNIVFSRDGTLMAACLTDDTGSPSVRIYDIYGATYTAAYIPTGQIIECGLTRYSFSPDGSMVAFGIFYHYPDPADPRPDWELVVMQTHGSAIVNRITANSPAITSLGGDYTGSIPLVTVFDPATVIAFRAVRYGTEPAPEYDSLIWQIGSGTVTINGPYGKTGVDFDFPNGEAIWIDQDPAFPVGVLEGPGHLFNVVMYSNKAGDRYPIFNNPGSVIFSAAFIDDGSKVAVRIYTSPSPEYWVYVDRATGSVNPLPPIDSYQVWGTLDGYVYLSQSGPGGAAQVRYGRFSGGAMPDTYAAWTGEPGEYWRIVYVNPISTGAGQAAFHPLVALAEPPVMVTLVPPVVLTPNLSPTLVIPPGGLNPNLSPTLVVPPGGLNPNLSPTLVIPPGGLNPNLSPTLVVPPVALTPILPPAVQLVTPTLPAPPPPVGTLVAGGTAIVHTTEGDMLRVRTGPGLNYQVTFQLPNGAQVTLREGPVSANGLTWWYIQTPDGRAGWAVEGVMDNGSYLPTLLPG